MSEHIPIRRALISVYDKSGLIDLARGLHAGGVEIISTGSTAAQIAAAGISVTPVEEVTGFPECLDGRVKTLHPRIHAGILADRRLPEHVEQLRELEVQPFDLVVVNLYPFADTVASGADFDACVEQIDIGGPAMVRAAAKNHPSVAVVVSPDSYSQVLDAVAHGGFTLTQRRALAAQAFQHTASYDVAVATWLGEQLEDNDFTGATYQRQAELRYGENPHQSAALFTDGSGTGLAAAKQLHGKEMSYNNYVDADAAWRAAHDHDRPAVAIIKHANPCGIAVGETIAQAHAGAHSCDPVSAFGGVIAANREIDGQTARQIHGIFTEVVVAPGFTDEAIEVLSTKKNLRLLVVTPAQEKLEERPISGGLLVQARDEITAPGDDSATWTLAAGEAADEATMADLEFAWRAVRAVKSNAILLAADGASVGVGMGQVNRVDSARLAVERANTLAADSVQRAAGSVASSDAFFPFADGLEILIDAGVKAVVQPGGSVRDEEVIAAAQEAGVTMYFTGTRHFFH